MNDTEKLLEDQKAEILQEMEKQNLRLLNVLKKSYNLLTEKIDDLKTRVENLEWEIGGLILSRPMPPTPNYLNIT